MVRRGRGGECEVVWCFGGWCSLKTILGVAGVERELEMQRIGR